MKKITVAAAVAVVSLILLASLSACTARPDYLSYVSELRCDLFCGEAENFSVVVYAGAKEKPFAFDGVKNPTALSLTVRVTPKEEVGEQLEVKFTLAEKQYAQKLAYNPVKSTLSCEVEVAALPKDELVIEVCYGQSSTVVPTVSKLREDSLAYAEALNRATEGAKDFLAKHSTRTSFNGEILLRLLCENEHNYYYVGFVTEEGLKLAYLIDAKTGEILATKSNE